MKEYKIRRKKRTAKERKMRGESEDGLDDEKGQKGCVTIRVAAHYMQKDELADY